MVGFITAARTKVTVALLVIASTSHLAGAGGPVVSSIVNGADQSAAPLAPGSIAILNGTALAGTSATFSAPLPTSSSGVSVSVNGLAAPLEAIGPTSITFQIPYETTLTTVAVTVTNGDLTSSAYSLSIAAASIGVFSVFNVSNSLQNSASHAVAPGAGLLAYVTGIGAVNPAVADGASATASPAVNNVSATINGVSAPVVFAGAVAGPPGFAQINLTVPSGLASGSYPLVFTENDRSSAPFTIFVDVPPTVTSVTPNHASPGAGNTAVSIAGSTFTQGSTVSWKAPNGTIVPISPSLIQAAQIAATIPAALLSTAGTAQVAVQDAAGVLSNSVSFSIGNPAVITSLTPNNALVGSSSASLSIAGQGIASGSTVSWTDVNGHVTSIAASLVQSAQVAATIPANLLTTIGTAEVAISDPSGVLSNQLPFTISPFAISSVTPSSAAVGTDSTAVAIAGQNITAGSNVFWTTPDGRTITISPSLLQAAQVRATIPSTLLTTAGTAQVAVANANGFPSNGLPFTIIPFTLTGVTPSTAPVGSGNTQITISGPGFSSSAQALFTPPGGPQTPISSLVQGAQIAATIPASMLTTAGTAQISVRNANGVVSTNLLPFTIVPAPLTIQTTAIPGGWVNSGYAPFTIQAIGGTGALTWSATGLPAGFTLNPTTGALGGSAGASAGIYSVTVHVTDSGTPTPQTTSKTFSLQISQQFVISTIAGGVPPATPVPATSVSMRFARRSGARHRQQPVLRLTRISIQSGRLRDVNPNRGDWETRLFGRRRSGGERADKSHGHCR